MGRGASRLGLLVYAALLMALLLPGAVPSVSADITTLVSAADTYVDANSATSNFGTGQSIDIGHDTAPTTITRRALIQFDLSPLFELEFAQVAEIVSASVTFECGQAETPTFTYGWHLITESWSESVVTWNTQPSFESVASVTNTSPSGCPADTFITDDITPLVASWFAGPNYGMVGVSSNESLDAHFILRSKEFTASPPELVVTFATVLPTGGQSSWFILAVGISVVVMLAALLNLIINGIESARDIVVLVVSIVIVIGVVGILVAGGF